MIISPDKQVYFLSDFHLGAPNATDSLVREKKIVQFLESIHHKAAAIFIVGDMFDFWYEYKTVIPKGFTRLLGTLAKITDSGVPVHFFIGNHDMWMHGYFEQELNIKVYATPQTFTFNNKTFYIAHGDGLGPGDYGYKFLKKVFRNPVCNWLFGFLHPTIGMGIANFFSEKSRKKTGSADEVFLGEDNEWLIIYSKQLLQQQHYHYLIFGHRHYPLQLQLGTNSEYINLGDWIRSFTYASFNGTSVTLQSWKP
jgi:UDP-2,3-diacylglucosamine hydrolase